MAPLTLKDISESLLERLRVRAASDRRSLTQEILFLLEGALGGATEQVRSEQEGETQADSWARLAGKWRSDLDPDEEIERILRARTEGRNVDL